MNEEKIFVRLKHDYKKNVELEIAALRGTTLYKYLSVEEYPKMTILRNNVVECGQKLAEFTKVALEKRAADIIQDQLRKKPPF